MDEFDDIRKKLDSFEEQPDENVWQGISSRLDAARPASSRRDAANTVAPARAAKPSWWRRPASWAVAAAACLTVALLVFRKPESVMAPQTAKTLASAPATSAPAPQAPATANTTSQAPATAFAAQQASVGTASTSSASKHVTVVRSHSANLASASGHASQAAASNSASKSTTDQNSSADGQNLALTSSENSAASTETSASKKDNTSLYNNTSRESARKDESGSFSGTAYPKEWDQPDVEEELYSFPSTLIAVNSNFGAGLGGNTFSYNGAAMFVSAKNGSNGEDLSVTQMGAGSYYMPLTFGAQAQVSFGKLSIGAGLSYTYLHSEYPALVNKEKFTVKNNVSYLGIPVNLYYSFIKESRFILYGNIGGMVEACLSAGGIYGSTAFTYDRSRPLFSVMGGIGCEYRFTPFLGVYFEPGFVYFINCTDETQPVSIRTAQPMQLRTELGLRIHLNY
jgi:hypothetical protein